MMVFLQKHENSKTPLFDTSSDHKAILVIITDTETIMFVDEIHNAIRFDGQLGSVSKSLEVGDLEGALAALNFSIEVLEQTRDDLREADKGFKRAGREVTKKLERSKKRLPAGKLEKHRDAVSKIKRENEGLDSQLSELLSLLGEAQDAVDADDAALALRKIDEAKVLLAGLKSKAGEITKRPRAKVSVPRELPTRPSKGKKIKPRMHYPKDKPRPVNPQGNPSPTESMKTWEKRTSKLNSYSSTIGGKTYANRIPETTSSDPALDMDKADYAVHSVEMLTDAYAAAKKSEYLSERGRAGAFKRWANRFGLNTAKGRGYLARSKASSVAAKTAYREATKASRVSKALGVLSAGITATETTINVKRDLDKGQYNNAVIDAGTGATKYGIVAAAILVTPVGWGTLGAIAVGVVAIAATALVDKGSKYLKRKYGE
jgi:hypothetical protein